MKKRDEIQHALSNEIIDNGYNLIANIACRVGKCKITLDTLNIKDDIIIAYPEISIKNSWINDIKRWKFKGKKVKYTTYKSFKKLSKAVSVLILDEVHTISKAQLIVIADYIKKFNISKVIALTGTLSSETETELFLALGLKVKVLYTNEQAIEDGVITDYRITVKTVPLSRVKDITVKWKGGEFITSEKDSFDYITQKIENECNPIRKKMLRLQRMSIIKKSKAKIELTKEILKELHDKRVLVFTGLIDVADGLGIDSYHSKSKVDKSVDFINGKTNKLAVVKQLNTGVTFKSLNTAIISFFDSNSENMAQRLSRVTCLEYDNENKIANIIVVSSTEEVEKGWLEKALSFFDKSKIKYE